MLRLVEIALFLMPFAMFAGWRLFMPAGPTRMAVVVSATALAVLAIMLVWLSRDDTLPPGTRYVPPHMQNGTIVPGSAAPP